VKEYVPFTEEQMDYLVELLNIGAGNAATALTELLQCTVSMTLPGVEIFPPTQLPSLLGDPALPVACTRMKMVGDMSGCLFFIVPEDQRLKLAERAEQALLGSASEPDSRQILGTLTEIGNILAGVYLTAIHDFCRLNVYHSVPVPAVDMVQALLDESLAARAGDDATMILIKNEFIIEAERAKAFFLIFPTGESVQTLVDSMKEVGKAYGTE
jgi:chemotaxis protein CheC